jgi:hypothetical protein
VEPDGAEGYAVLTDPDLATCARPPTCVFATRSAFHLRAVEAVSREGSEEIATQPRVRLLFAGRLRRGSEHSFYVRLLDGTRRHGWMFITPGDLSAECPAP